MEVVLTTGSTDSGVHVWDVLTGTRLASYRNNASAQNCVTRVGSAAFAAAQAGGGVHFWTWGRDQPCVRCFPAEPLCCLAGSADGCVLAGGTASGVVTLWLVSTGQVLRTWQAHHKAVSQVAFTADASWLVTGGQDTCVCVWPLNHNVLAGPGDAAAGLEAAHTWQAHTLPVTGVATGSGTASQLVCSVSLDRTAVVWTLAGGGARLRTLLFPAALTCCALDPCDWALYAGAMDGRIFTAPLAGGDDAPGHEATGPGAAQQLVGHTRAVRCVASTSDGAHLVSCGDDGNAVVWCTSTWQALRSLAHSQPPAPVSHVLLAPAVAATAMAAGPGEARIQLTPPLAPLAKYHLSEAARLHNGSGAAKPWEGPLVVLCGHGAQQPRPLSGVAVTGATHDAPAAQQHAEDLAAQLQQARDEAARWKALHGQMRALVTDQQT